MERFKLRHIYIGHNADEADIDTVIEVIVAIALNTVSKLKLPSCLETEQSICCSRHPFLSSLSAISGIQPISANYF